MNWREIKATLEREAVPLSAAAVGWITAAAWINPHVGERVAAWVFDGAIAATAYWLARRYL